MLFHLGVLRRLGELGILTRSDFRTVASVSGGSIVAAGLADALTHVVAGAGAAISREVWDREVAGPLRDFTRKDVRTRALLGRLGPRNRGDVGSLTPVGIGNKNNRSASTEHPL